MSRIIQDKIRINTGLDPEKPVSSLSVEQLYVLIRFAVTHEPI